MKKKRDRLVLKIGKISPENRFVSDAEYNIDINQELISDAYVLRDSYFKDKRSIVLAGRCLLNIRSLINGRNFRSCISGPPNFSLGKISPISRLVLLDSSRFEGKLQMYPYVFNLFDNRLRLLASLTLDDGLSTLKMYNQRFKIPEYLVFLNYSFRSYEEPTNLRIDLVNLRNSRSTQIESLDLFPVSLDLSQVIFRSSLELTNNNSVSYISANVKKGNYDEINIWVYEISAGRKYCKFNLKFDDEIKNQHVTDNFKHHLYSEEILLIEDHAIYLIKDIKMTNLYRNSLKNQELILDAILLE